jgi:hypothetical protein
MNVEDVKFWMEVVGVGLSIITTVCVVYMALNSTK